ALGTESFPYTTLFRSGSRGTPVGGPSLLIPARQLVLVEREQDRLAADREVPPLGEALVVLGHQDPARVGVPVEHDPEHVVDLARSEEHTSELQSPCNL